MLGLEIHRTSQMATLQILHCALHKIYQHEAFIQHMFRNLKAYDRKIKKAKAKHNEELAVRLRSLKPGYKVDHLVKERSVENAEDTKLIT
jgi:hypothetical protein